MSNELLQHGDHHQGPEFEHEDWSPRAVYGFLAVLALIGVLVYFVIRGFYAYMDAYERNRQPSQNPLVTSTTKDTRVVAPGEVEAFPKPRLETDERGQINNFRLGEEQKLDSYGWVDQNAGVVRIPIDRAMELIAQRGLPTTPKAGTVPPSPVNTARKAAAAANKK
jgi:hypothetical protein